MRRVLHRRTQRSKTRLESNERGQKLRMEKREPDVGIAVVSLPYPCTIIMRCRRRGMSPG